MDGHGGLSSYVATVSYILLRRSIMTRLVSSHYHPGAPMLQPKLISSIPTNYFPEHGFSVTGSSLPLTLIVSLSPRSISSCIRSPIPVSALTPSLPVYQSTSTHYNFSPPRPPHSRPPAARPARYSSAASSPPPARSAPASACRPPRAGARQSACGIRCARRRASRCLLSELLGNVRWYM